MRWKPQYGFFSNIGRLLWTAIAAVAGYHYFGLAGFVLAYALSELPAYLVMAYGTTRENIRLWPQDIWLTGLLILALAGILGGRYALGWGLPFMPTSG